MIIQILILLLFTPSINQPHKLCSQCSISNCISCLCSNLNICLKCKQGYQFISSSQNTASQCRSISQMSMANKISFLLFGFFLIYFIAAIFRCVKKKYFSKKRILDSAAYKKKYDSQEIIQQYPSQQQTQKRQQQQLKSNYIQQVRQLPFKYQVQYDICKVCNRSNCDIITICNHYFHLQCLKQWLVQYQTCPICKRKEQIQKVSIIKCLICKDIVKIVYIFETMQTFRCLNRH